jgi:protein-S-isoprenylcysteine O-methyltransferase Ste14
MAALMRTAYAILLFGAVGAAVIRSAWLVIGLARLVPVHLRARTRRWGLVEVLALAEIPVFLALTAALVLRPLPAPTRGGLSLLAAASGAWLALAGVFVSLWAISSTLRRGVILDAGHFVKAAHPLVTTGAYGFVRNPMYLGVILIWLGLAVALLSGVLLLACVAYIVPVFWLYILAEERMMSSGFGAQFEDYQRRVGRLLPRWHRAAS